MREGLLKWEIMESQLLLVMIRTSVCVCVCVCVWECMAELGGGKEEETREFGAQVL